MANATLPPESVIKNLIGAGFLVTAVAHEPNYTTLELIPHLLRDPASANKTLSPFFPGVDVIDLLHKLNAILPELPRDEIWLKISIIYAVMQFIALVVVGLRFYVRMRITPKRLRLEDWACLATLCVITAWMGSMWAQNRYTGRHIYTLDIKDIRVHQIYMTVTGIIFTTCHAFVKYTFLVFYYRLYPNSRYHKAVIAVAVYVTIVATIPLLLLAFGCRPLDWWNHLATAKCINRLEAFTFQGVAFILADFMILSLPVPIVFTLQLKLRDKVLLAAMFGLGGFISIISILRLLALREWLVDPDFSYAFGKQVMWASAEIVLSLVVACAPSLKAGIAHIFMEGEGGSSLPRGFSKWSFTPGGMFKRSNRSSEKSGEESGSETDRKTPAKHQERNGGGTDWGNGRRAGWGMRGKKGGNTLDSTQNTTSTGFVTDSSGNASKEAFAVHESEPNTPSDLEMGGR